MTNDDLIRLGFKEIPHFTITNSVIYDLGRHRQLSAGCVGTPNEMVHITETDDQLETKITDCICLHNYDYDGYLTETKIKSIIISITGGLHNRSTTGVKYEKKIINTISAESVLKETAIVFECSVGEITGKSRKANIVKARNMAMYTLRNELRFSFERAGSFVNRDHATAIRACRIVRNSLKIDEYLKYEQKPKNMNGIKTKNPDQIIIGETYMINEIGWKKIKVMAIKGSNITVRNFKGDGSPFTVNIKRIRVNLM